MMQGNMEMFVRRMFTDAAFKESALRNPETAMAGYRLSSAEKMAASKLCARILSPEGVAMHPGRIWF